MNPVSTQVECVDPSNAPSLFKAALQDERNWTSDVSSHLSMCEACRAGLVLARMKAQYVLRMRDAESILARFRAGDPAIARREVADTQIYFEEAAAGGSSGTAVRVVEGQIRTVDSATRGEFLSMGRLKDGSLREP